MKTAEADAQIPGKKPNERQTHAYKKREDSVACLQNDRKRPQEDVHGRKAADKSAVTAELKAVSADQETEFNPGTQDEASGAIDKAVSGMALPVVTLQEGGAGREKEPRTLRPMAAGGVSVKKAPPP